MDDREFRETVKESLAEGRERAKDLVLREYGDEFGPVDLGNFADLRRIFSDPFKDALQVAKGSLAKVSNRAWTAVSVVLKGIPSLVVPFLATKYDNIYAREKQRAMAIEQKYGEVFDKANKLFDTEADKVAFMLNPVAVLTLKSSTSAADEVLDVVDALAGGDRSVMDRTEKLRRVVGVSAEGLSLRRCLLEHGEEQRSVEELLADQEFVQALNSAPIVREMVTDARAMKNESLNEILRVAEQIAAIRTLDDAGQVLKKPIDTVQFRSLKDEERAAAVQSYLSMLKSTSIENIVDTLELQLKELEKQRLSGDDSDLVAVTKKVLDRVDAMSR